MRAASLQLNVKKLTNDKCDSSQAILILEFAFEGDCSAQDGHCTQAVSLDLAPVSSICGYGSPLPNYDSAAVKAYFVGWAAKGVNWVSDPDRWSQQVSTLVFGLNNQSVSGSKLNLDFEAWASAAHPGDGFSPENRAISARVEVVAVNPNYAEYVKIDLDTGHGGRTPCPLTRFRFEVEPWFKYNELIAEGTDCDRVFGGTALYEMKVQGDSFKDTGSGGPDQSPVAFCPEPSGASYVCLQKPAWSGLIWLDTAILE